ncbi:hypothetical protein PLICRDRAFT_44089 [Plicaturopsis crispa FD-325 SS-3]|nr:hypothetical protein PLICRDRAFT_44089 [Plicaturopsis crispa FD-325 SS-3]
MGDFPALPGFYKTFYLHIEPVSTLAPALLVFLFPGAGWFHSQLVPDASSTPKAPLDDRTTMAVWQLANCYMLLCLISSFVFRAVRDALPNNPVAQERILGASFTALAIADATHIAASFIGLPENLRYNPTAWNATTHGNISFVVLLLGGRLAWFFGIGRKRYYYGQTLPKPKSS